MKKIILSLIAILLSLLPACLRRSVVPSDDQRVFTLPNGATFRHAPSWTIDDTGAHATVSGPENDFLIHILEGASIDNTEEQATLMWKTVSSEFSYPILQKINPPKDKGWERIEQIIYDVPAKEAKTILAIALTFKEKTNWLLIEASNAALSKRGAEMMLIFGSFRAAGMQEESLAHKKAKSWGAAEKEEFQDFLIGAMEKQKVPGATVAIVNSKGDMLFKGAYGVKDVSTKEAVTISTPFMIGSTTKALTTLMMARLIDQKKLSWSTKITELLKDFKVDDEELTQNFDIKNSVSASTGMPARIEFIFKYAGVSAADRVSELALMKPTTKMGETFQYSNHMFMAGGYAAAKAYAPKANLETAYAQVMSELVFDPLGMKNSVLKSSDALKLGGAMPHAKTIEGKSVRIPLEREDAIYSVAPAGAVWSTVEDLSRYVVLELNKGYLDGKKLVDTETLLARRQPGAKISDTQRYGLGLFVEDHQGINLVGHNGATVGFASLLFFLPEHDLGMVILSNAYASNMFVETLKQKFFELTFDVPKKSSETIDFALQLEQQFVDQMKGRIKTDKPSLAWIKNWTGTYENSLLGSITISERPHGGFEFDCGEWKSALASEREPSGTRNLFLTEPPFFFKFQPDEKNQQLILDAGQEKYEFKRKRS